MKSLRLSAMALALAMVAAVAGCDDQAADGDSTGSGDAPRPEQQSEADGEQEGESDGEAAEPVTITVEQSGGEAGARHSLTVQADGTWSYAKQKMAPETGQLGDDELAELTDLAADPALAGAETPESSQDCSDYLVHTLMVDGNPAGEVDVSTGECGEKPTESFGEIIELLTEATPL